MIYTIFTYTHSGEHNGEVVLVVVHDAFTRKLNKTGLPANLGSQLQQHREKTLVSLYPNRLVSVLRNFLSMISYYGNTHTTGNNLDMDFRY